MKTTDARSLFGIPFSNCSLTETISLISESIRKKSNRTFYPLNVHILLELKKNREVARKIRPGDVVFADGIPIVWLFRLVWPSDKPGGRVSGTDLVECLLKNTGFRSFIVGSSTENMRKIVNRYGRSGFGGSICGWYCPPFGNAWNGKVDEKILQKIADARPDILFVGVGPLKQERWIQKYDDVLGVPVRIPVGSAFDILSGSCPRAPRLLQQMGLEWAWRVTLEPKRLWLRYLSDAVGLFRLIIAGNSS